MARRGTAAEPAATMKLVALLVMGASLAGCTGCEDKGAAPANADIPDPASLTVAADGSVPRSHQKTRMVRPRMPRVVQPKQAP